MDAILKGIINSVVNGDRGEVEKWVKEGISAGIAPGRIMDEGLIGAMSEVGSRFEMQEF
jgi:methanogenic corrinoid protein MtbC1